MSKAESFAKLSLDEAANTLASTSAFREALDMIVSGKTGALICIGDTAGVQSLASDGFAIDVAFTPQRLSELAKMDGAILLSDDASRILSANLHLTPDASLASKETGMRHRTAELMSKQTDALVVSISQRRDSVALYCDGERMYLHDLEDQAAAKTSRTIFGKRRKG